MTCFPAGGTDSAIDAAVALDAYLGAGLDPARVALRSDWGGCLRTIDGEGRLTHMRVGTSFSMASALTGYWKVNAPPRLSYLPSLRTQPNR
ncbi:MAG: hypothetical protein ACI9F9_001747 [Candidatus Paceibacteria bacterium]|jgi:hypothetical protein